MIRVIRCGYESRHRTKFQMVRKTGVPNYILLLVKTEAFFEIEGSVVKTYPNMAILFDRNTSMNYGSIKDYYNDDWIHFDFVEEPSMLDKLQVPLNKPIYISQLPMLSNYVRLLVQGDHSRSIHKEQIQDSLMRLILYNLDAKVVDLQSPADENMHYQTLNHLRLEIHNTPHKKWTVETMAASVHMSHSYFQHLYKELFHISCIQEVIQARIERAKYYLSTTDMPISAVSNSCGYESQMHFLRQFKKRENLTPSQFRQLYQVHS